jgi:hypothetical protein
MRWHDRGRIENDKRVDYVPAEHGETGMIRSIAAAAILSAAIVDQSRPASALRAGALLRALACSGAPRASL